MSKEEIKNLTKELLFMPRTELIELLISQQQENTQLKEELNKYKRIYRENPTLYDEIAPYIINECNLENKIKQYKSVLDEIREYITKELDEPDPEDYREYTVDISWFNELLQILDKVKE